MEAHHELFASQKWVQNFHSHKYVSTPESLPYIVFLKKSIPVTGRGGLSGCEMLRIPHCLDSRLTDCGKAVSSTHQPHFTPQKHFFL
jgi:hypothetical protein